MAKKNRSGNKSKRAGSSCSRKMMTPKQAKDRKNKYIKSRRHQSDLDCLKCARQRQREYKLAA